MAKTSEKLELISSLGESLSQKELQLREVSEKLLQTELSVSDTLRPRRRCFRHAAFFSFVLCLSRAAGEGLPGRQPLRETVLGAESRGGRPDAQAERAEGEGKHLWAKWHVPVKAKKIFAWTLQPLEFYTARTRKTLSTCYSVALKGGCVCVCACVRTHITFVLL